MPAALAIGWRVDLVRTTGLAAEGRTALEAGISRELEEETGTPLEADPGVQGDITDRARDPAAAAAPPAWALEAGAEALEAEGPVAAEAGAEDKEAWVANKVHRSPAMRMSRNQSLTNLLPVLWVLTCVSLAALGTFATQQPAREAAQTSPVASAQTFATPEQAAAALVDAAEKFDVRALEEIFGPDGDDIVLSGEYPLDRQRAAEFASEAHEKKGISVDPKKGNRAFLLVGDEDWPFPAPLVKLGDKWYFDAKAGRQELFNRRIGSNELDAIDICNGYVESQYEYALQPREGYNVNQYAQRIVSTPGKQDGLAWQNEDGSWGGPIGEKIAQAIEQGYSDSAEPYHGYFFKILKGQGPAAPLGELDYLVKGVMIGGFALAAAPAEYGETGVKTFIVSQDGVVYEKDFGPATLSEFTKMERFNPDPSWKPVAER